MSSGSEIPSRMSFIPSMAPIPQPQVQQVMVMPAGEEEPPPKLLTMTIKQFYETKFKSMISHLGSYKIKMKESGLLLPYYMVKLSCETERYKFETIVVGDECDDEESAKENVFQKAFNVLEREYKADLKDMRKRTRTQSGNGTSNGN